MSMDKVFFDSLSESIKAQKADRIFVVTDSNVARIEAELIKALSPQYTCIVKSGEENKCLEEVARIASELSANGATRNSLLICIGGGMVTDLGGFVAAIFKRGIRHMNISTTLLGAVDASIGGKTGVDFNGLKNELGAFHNPVAIFADTRSFSTLPPEEILSGFGEVIKTALIADRNLYNRLILSDPFEIKDPELTEICSVCKDIKSGIVEADPTEQGLRKVLNLGHTAGHAFESLMIEKGCGVPHGVAVAHGLLVTLLLSIENCGLNQKEVSRYAAWLRRHYPSLPFTCSDYDRLWQLARHDKKNNGAEDSLNFVLLESPGHPLIDRRICCSSFEQALDLYQELQGR